MGSDSRLIRSATDSCQTNGPHTTYNRCLVQRALQLFSNYTLTLSYAQTRLVPGCTKQMGMFEPMCPIRLATLSCQADGAHWGMAEPGASHLQQLQHTYPLRSATHSCQANGARRVKHAHSFGCPGHQSKWQWDANPRVFSSASESRWHMLLDFLETAPAEVLNDGNLQSIVTSLLKMPTCCLAAIETMLVLLWE